MCKGVAYFFQRCTPMVGRLGVCILILINGCETLSPEEREWNRAIDLENWQRCAYVYAQNGGITVHVNHSHKRHADWNDTDYWYVRSDLVHNICRSILRNQWIHY